MYDVCVCVVVVVFVVDDNIAVILKSRSRFSRFSRFSLSLSLSLSLSVSVVFFFTNHQQKWTFFFHATHLSLFSDPLKTSRHNKSNLLEHQPRGWLCMLLRTATRCCSPFLNNNRFALFKSSKRTPARRSATTCAFFPSSSLFTNLTTTTTTASATARGFQDHFARRSNRASSNRTLLTLLQSPNGGRFTTRRKTYGCDIEHVRSICWHNKYHHRY